MASAGSSLLLIGATQGVGESLIEGLISQSDIGPLSIHAVSRNPRKRGFKTNSQLTIEWHQHDLSDAPLDRFADWVVSAGPVGLLLSQLQHWKAHNQPRAVWALSSASPDFKSASSDASEREEMKKIEHAEQALIQHCQSHDIVLQLYKTTMLYGRADQNINRLANLMSRLAWFPVAGNGQRAPVHVDDIAGLIQSQLRTQLSGAVIETGVWRLQGGECLGYRTMLQRIAQARGIKVRLLPVPAPPMQWLLRVLHAIGRLRDVKASMIGRQDMDLVVDDADARQRLDWAPGPFRP